MRYITILFLCFTINSFAQVVNIETLRKASDSTKWIGSVSLNLSLIKTKNDIFRITNKVFIQFNDETNLWLFLNDLNIQKTEDSDLVNRGIQHLRYNRKITNRLKWEAFGQVQYDAISQIDFRGLLGTGIRIKLSTSEHHRFHLGTSVMFEHEKASNTIPNRIQNDLRGSGYISFTIYPTPYIRIISTNYYQPKLELFSDYRLSSNTSILFEIYKNLAFKANFNYNYDAVPVSTTIPKTQYELTNGLLFSF